MSLFEPYAGEQDLKCSAEQFLFYMFEIKEEK